jgi:hypothetical protein
LGQKIRLVRASVLSHWHGFTTPKSKRPKTPLSLMLRSITMTEKEIERTAERRMDMLDRHLMVGNLSQVQYEQLVQDLERWSKEEYAKLRKEQ